MLDWDPAWKHEITIDLNCIRYATLALKWECNKLMVNSSLPDYFPKALHRFGVKTIA